MIGTVEFKNDYVLGLSFARYLNSVLTKWEFL